MSGLTVEDATRLQREAADPSAPRMVNANAGSGKTKVLVDRVSRILLQGTDPDKILCLTYTRAAASEMQERLFRTFSSWSILPDAALKTKLEALYGCPFDAIRPVLELNDVRTLFARALETPEGLKVMTIHAFCERIIARFPIEAGIMPGFAPLDDTDTTELLKAGHERLLIRAQTDPELGQALHHLARAKADQTLDDMLQRSATDFDRIKSWRAAGGLAAFRKACGLRAEDTAENVAATAWQETDQARLKQFGDLCRGQGGYAERFATAIAAALSAKAPQDAFAIYSGVVLKADGSVTSQMPTKSIRQQDDFLSQESPEAARVEAQAQRVKAARLAQMSESYLALAYAYGADYQRAKHAIRGLDFNDLIIKTRDLLTRTDVSDWVAYKLDGGVEHVLLDEAQDTSPQQWQIIDAITAPFRQDSPDRDGPRRTFFAVGDPKQSIYRFQGAAPKLFMQAIRERAQDGKGVTLRMSFRSAQHVLDVVDALFLDQQGMAEMFDPETVPETSDRIDHVAHRQDPGCVELWPLAPRSDDMDEREPWDTTPVDAMGETDPKVRLAREIAATVKRWVDRKDPIFDRDWVNPDGTKGGNRPIQAGDVLILVQKRIGGLFDAIIRELKRAGLPVAGADRLVLQEAVIVRDLLAITRFVLLPSDCLSLAEALKSPLFGLDDSALFDLCVDRGSQTLWQAVQARRPDLAEYLDEILRDAALAPYDFYARLLDRRGPHGLSYREALFRRLGLEAREALDAFLGLALAHQQRQAPSLQRFLQAFMADEVEIKRDKDPAGQEIRVMTVHGAKGLEAPIVFMPDTTRGPSRKASGLIAADESYILAPSSRDSIPLTDAYKDAHNAEDWREYMRLLYVAMTRAESRLIICGAWHGRSQTGFDDGSWYGWVARTFEDLEMDSFDTVFDGQGRQGLRYGSLPVAIETEEVHATQADVSLPSWINQTARPERRKVDTASPSTLLAKDEPMGRGPGSGRFQRGILIHRLLEILPDHPAPSRNEVARTVLGTYPDVTPEEREAINAEVFSVLDHPNFSVVFAEGSKAEVSLAGRVSSIRGGTVFLTAQIDRLNVTPETVFLVDYKSNRPAPEHVDGVDPVYLAQMAAYRELARAIWPNRAVRCGLLWTEAPRMMWLHDNAMDAALTAVNALPTS